MYTYVCMKKIIREEVIHLRRGGEIQEELEEGDDLNILLMYEILKEK